MNIINAIIDFILYVGEVKIFKYKVAKKITKQFIRGFLEHVLRTKFLQRNCFFFEYNTIYYSIVSNTKTVLDLDESRIDKAFKEYVSENSDFMNYSTEEIAKIVSSSIFKSKKKNSNKKPTREEMIKALIE